MTTSFRPRWWYLLLLLPFLLYFGARWWVGDRLSDRIAAANRDGNVLELADYSFGLLPAFLEVSGARFSQSRPGFVAEGKIDHLLLDGIHLFSLLGDGPLRLDRLHLTGLDADLRRRDAPPSDGGEPTRLHIGEIVMADNFLRLTDEPTGRTLDLEDLHIDLRDFRTPLDWAGTQVQGLTIEAITHRDPRGSDLRLGGLRIGPELDSLTVATVSGRLVLAESAERDSVGRTTSVDAEFGAVALRRVDLEVSGGFGTAHFRGGVTADRLDLRGPTSVAELRIDGDSLRFANAGALTVGGHGLQLRQGKLSFPLRPGELGATQLRLAGLTVDRRDNHLTFDAVDYASEEGRLTVGGSEVDLGATTLELGEVRLTGFDRGALLSDSTLVADALDIDRLHGTVSRSDNGRSGDNAAPGIQLGALRVSDIDLYVSGKTLGGFRLRGPELTVTDVSGRDGLAAGELATRGLRLQRTDAAGTVTLDARNIQFTQSGLRLPLRPTELGRTRVSAGHVTLPAAGEALDYQFYGTRYDSDAEVLTLDSINRTNRLPPGRFHRERAEKSWLDFHFGRLRLTGLSRGEVVERQEIHLSAVSAAGFNLMVVEDIGKPSAEREKKMPLEALRALDIPLRIDRIRLDSAIVHYGVIDTLLEPKTIRFGPGPLTIERLDTRPSTTDSVTVAYESVFERRVPLSAHFALSRSPGGRDFAMRGSLGAYDLTNINPLMVVAADARVQSGQIERMTYTASMRRDTIRGAMDFYYRDLDLKLVGSGGFFKNLLAGLVLKEHNQDGEDFRPGKIYHEHAPTRSFFNAYWKGLVSGMRSSSLSKIALPEELEN